MDNNTITSLSEYVNVITSIKVNPSSVFNSFALVFRGQSNCSYELIPSIGRDRKTSVDVSMLNEERNLIELAKYKMPDVFDKNMTPVELLALLQHHGIPTRLLDVTENALVALFFACIDNFDKDGEVITFRYNDLEVATYPVVYGLAETYKFARSTEYFIKDFYEDIIEQPYFTEHRYRKKNKDSYDGARWICNICDGPIFVYAPIRSIRQRVQAGRYILFPNKINTDSFNGVPTFESIIEPIPKDSEYIVNRIIIPKENKNVIMEQLRIMGITREALFCDSIDSVCEGIVETCKRRI